MTEENKSNPTDQAEDSFNEDFQDSIQDSSIDSPKEQRKAELFVCSFLAGMFGGAVIVGCLILVLLFTPSLSSLRKNMTDTSCSLQNKGLSQIISYPLCCPFYLGFLGEPLDFIETFKGLFSSFIRHQGPQKPQKNPSQETPNPHLMRAH